MRPICNMILLFLEDSFFSGPSLQTFYLLLANKSWRTIVNEQYPLFREDAHLNHIKKQFTNEMLSMPNLQKYSSDKKFVIAIQEIWKKTGQTVFSHSNRLYEMIVKEHFRMNRLNRGQGLYRLRNVRVHPKQNVFQDITILITAPVEDFLVLRKLKEWQEVSTSIALEEELQMKMMKSFGRQPSKLKLAKMPEPCSVTPFRSPANSNRLEKMSPRSKQLRHITENLINLGPKCVDFS